VRFVFKGLNGVGVIPTSQVCMSFATPLLLIV
jgi:hypothetical protein